MLLIWVEGLLESVAEMVAQGSTDARGPTELRPGHPLSAPEAPGDAPQCLLSHPECFSGSGGLEKLVSGESSPQIAYLGTRLPGMGSVGWALQASAPHTSPALCPAPHSSWAAPAQGTNPDSSEASREADLS